jgi:CBS domain containing-hemolysin-like protein
MPYTVGWTKHDPCPYRTYMRGIDIKAIVLATLAVFGIDFASSLALVAVFGEPLVNATDEQSEAAMRALAQNPSYLKAAIVLGTASSIVGGYLVARLAANLPYFNALAFGLLSTLLGALLSVELPAWSRIIGLSLTIPAALLGAYISKRQGQAAT